MIVIYDSKHNLKSERTVHERSLLYLLNKSQTTILNIIFVFNTHKVAIKDLFQQCQFLTVDQCYEIELEVNADKTKYMIMSRDQNAGRSHSMKNDNSSIERVE